MARARRNAFIERWAGREWELRARQPEVTAAVERARETGDVDNAALLIGQDAGLIHDIPPAGEIVERIVAEAEALLKDRLPKLMRVS
jgi:NAD(P)H-dependent flavin oxidoreductase YrpB (nitropropane dioxygenase family)